MLRRHKIPNEYDKGVERPLAIIKTKALIMMLSTDISEFFTNDCCTCTPMQILENQYLKNGLFYYFNNQTLFFLRSKLDKHEKVVKKTGESKCLVVDYYECSMMTEQLPGK